MLSSSPSLTLERLRLSIPEGAQSHFSFTKQSPPRGITVQCSSRMTITAHKKETRGRPRFVVVLTCSHHHHTVYQATII